MICLPPTQEDSLNIIFKSILEGYLLDVKKDLQMMGKHIVGACILTFTKITSELRPTPAKSHYTFNLRDISKVIQGMLMAKPSAINRQDKLARLWVHESCRVFQDRLVSKEDKEWFNEMVIDLANNTIRVEVDNGSNIIFGDFMLRGVSMDERSYEEISDHAKLTDIIMQYQEEYNIDHPTKLDLVLFAECL